MYAVAARRFLSCPGLAERLLPAPRCIVEMPGKRCNEDLGFQQSIFVSGILLRITKLPMMFLQMQPGLGFA
jgi:hypothetical protein